MDRKALLAASVAGTVAQVAMVVIGHFVPWVANNLFALGGVALSAAAGVIYARKAGPGSPLLGGAAAGAICAVIGIIVSVLLGDVPWIIVLVGGAASAVGGLAGAWGQRLLSGRIARRPPR